MNKKSKEYKESELSSLLVEWSKENGHQGVKKIMPSIMKGLPITISSKPDLIAPLDKRGSKNDVQILMGEFRNGKTYNVNRAKTQCVMYRLGLLYFLGAELGKPVETVYRFFVCGVQCQDQDKTYTVGLVRLSAPQKLGEEIKATYFLQKGSRGNSDLHPANYVWTNLGEFHLCSHFQRVCGPTPMIASLFILHKSLSIVFRISGRSLQALRSNDSPHFKNLRNSGGWERLCDEVTSLLKMDGDDTRYYFLKIRSKDLNLQDRPMGEMCNVWNNLMGKQSSETPGQQVVFDSLSKTYPVKPCLAV
eukprot:scaffold5333_cov74-Cylindrotheca_fusiformis.AAC.1